MHDATLDGLIAQALHNRTRTPLDGPRNDNGRSWKADYGPRIPTAQMDAQRLDARSGGRIDDPSGSQREDRLEPSDRRFAKALWREIMGFCPGTKVFLMSVGVVAFIVVL